MHRGAERPSLKDKVLAKERSTQAPRTPPCKMVPDPDLSGKLLKEAAREAGLFQRSVLGLMDHKDWTNRVSADGQRLVDLLHDMGFMPSDDRPNRTKLKQ